MKKISARKMYSSALQLRGSLERFLAPKGRLVKAQEGGPQQSCPPFPLCSKAVLFCVLSMACPHKSLFRKGFYYKKCKLENHCLEGIQVLV